ncbi:MAG: hypothetical protein ACI9QR_000327 [Flavobacteriaceae bacterium]|jgi:hypothetical protein
MARLIIVLFFMFEICPTIAQSNRLPITFVLGGNSMSIENILEIETAKFYVGNFELFNNSKLVFSEEKYHLIDLKSDEMLQVMLGLSKELDYNRIEFTLGVDSTTNENGAMGGDLDPTKGMYWTWQSGYVNLKLEGQLGKNEFEFHLGGFTNGNKCEQLLQFACQTGAAINIEFDLINFLEKTDLEETSQVMSPGSTAVELMGIAKESFHLVE